MNCSKCGNPMKDGDKFCFKCGTPVVLPDNPPQMTESNVNKTKTAITEEPMVVKNTTTTQGGNAPKNKTVWIVLAVVVAVLLLAGALVFALFKIGFGSRSSDNTVVNTTTEIATTESITTTESEATTEESKVDNYYDLDSGGMIQLRGTCARKVLALNESINVKGKDVVDNKEVTLNNVYSVVVDEGNYEGITEYIKEQGYEVKITGKAFIESGKMHISIETVKDAKSGDNIISYYYSYDELSNNYDPDYDFGIYSPTGYIISYSDTLLLDKSDIQGFTLQELNYAKNEIYARHGRKFKSKELRDYFNTKTWYYVDPDYSDSMLSKTEQKNANFLASAEKKLAGDSVGYKLDQ